jgi:signal transduction histidine kinase
MARRLRQLNLWRATPVIALSIAAAVVAAGVFIALYTEHASTEQKAREVTVQGRILASTVSAALAFDDPAAAREYVNALRVNPEVLQAAVYDTSGALFASFSRAGEPPARLSPAAASAPLAAGRDRMTVVTPVIQDATPLGAVYLQVLAEPPRDRLMRFGIIALLTTMVAVVVAVLGVAHATLGRVNDRLVRQSDELAAANVRLLQQIEERERAEAALRQAQKMEAIGQLTGGVAHDFNNLLQIILSSLGVLKRRAEGWGLAPEAARDFQRLTNAATVGGERAAALTRQLLAFARRQPLAPTRIDVNRLVAGMSELLRRTLGEAVAVETVLAGGLWPTFADTNQLESALLNLAVNARDAMPGGGRLTIETANAHLDEGYVRSYDDVKPGQYVMLAVTDTGSGMPADVLARVFEPFFTTKDIGQGTGLGLSQVYGFVKQSDGHIKIYSEPGAGTTVKLYLPRMLVLGTDKPGPPPEEALPGTRAERVLVVEDEDGVRAFAVEMLRELGYGIVEAADGPTALAVIEADPSIRLLFTDVGLPGGMNGRQLADAALRRRPDLKVLFTSGYTRNAIVHGGRLDAGVALIGKPFTYADLARKIREVLDGASV